MATLTQFLNNQHRSYRKFPVLMKPECLSPCSQEHAATGIYPELEEFSPHPQIIFLLDPF